MLFIICYRNLNDDEKNKKKTRSPRDSWHSMVCKHLKEAMHYEITIFSCYCYFFLTNGLALNMHVFFFARAKIYCLCSPGVTEVNCRRYFVFLFFVNWDKYSGTKRKDVTSV